MAGYNRKRYLICYLMNDGGIPSTQIYEISKDTEIDDCSYPENTVLLMIVNSEKTIGEISESILGLRSGQENTAYFAASLQNFAIEDDTIYTVSKNDILTPYKLKY